MILKGNIQMAHDILLKAIERGDVVIDATVGNGHDTLFLANAVGEEGLVYGFDIQEQAIENTKKRLIEAGKNQQVKLILDGHHRLEQYIDENTNIKAAIFNLGYLPKGDKTIVTKPDTTIKAVKAIQNRLVIGGVIALVIYPGHPEGTVEANTLLPFFKSLDQHFWRVIKIDMFNQVHEPPFLIVLEKRK
ncbi:methyltransferase domain-containing protein [Terrilactibacillus sp. BCM23-1]|uniref:Methyltransferase domain-containing protein n=1 Tax=Terrilactibacillus tamarindi TaxID=2599694 RepID=A0A6N8CU53_9BACI|nr:class I SAM-dependent methyltransferase [Terrilactibacillus tamarindi]MTT32555.1 methyltransferase domain-containing protein [Terrilactibacillus tamarindi]